MFLPSEARVARTSPFFPLSDGGLRAVDRRVISGIVFVIRNGLRRRDVLPGQGPHKTICNRFVRWSGTIVFRRIFVELAKGGGATDGIMIDVEPTVSQRSENRCRRHLDAPRTAASLLDM